MKLIKLGFEAKEAIKNGINKAAEVVQLTLGPSANTVIIDNKIMAPTITDDGVSVAKEVELEDTFENVGAKLITEIASKTNDEAGDGTTTATVLARALVNETFQYLISPSKSIGIKNGMDKALKFITDKLKTIKTDIKTKEEIKQIATISSLDEEVGTLLSDMMEEVGADGTITLEEGQGTTLETEVVKGLQFDKGFLSHYFITDEQEAVWENPYILITEQKISTLGELLPVLEKVVDTKRSLVIIAEEVTGEALTGLVLNKLRGTFQGLAVQAPAYGQRRKEMLQDIAALTGGKVVDNIALTLKTLTLADLGQARKVISTQSNTTIIGGVGSPDDRVAELRKQIEASTSEFEKSELKKRVARLVGGVGVIKVGAFTETEMKAKKFKIEDALNATRAAVEEGIIPGGGSVLARLSPEVKAFAATLDTDEKLGAEIVASAITAPFLQMAANTGVSPAPLLEKVQGSEEGYDFKNHKLGNLLEMGVVDPVKVTRLALENAVSVAGILATSQAIIVDKPEDKKKDNE